MPGTHCIFWRHQTRSCKSGCSLQKYIRGTPQYQGATYHYQKFVEGYAKIASIAPVNKKYVFGFPMDHIFPRSTGCDPSFVICRTVPPLLRMAVREQVFQAAPMAPLVLPEPLQHYQSLFRVLKELLWQGYPMFCGGSDDSHWYGCFELESKQQIEFNMLYDLQLITWSADWVKNVTCLQSV